MMKILHLDYDDFNNGYAGGGQAVVTYEIYKRLKRRHTITVLTGNFPGAKNEIIDGIEYRRIGLSTWGSTMSLLSYWILTHVYVLFLSKDFDLVVEFFTPPFSVSFISFFTKKPILAWPTFLNAKNMADKYHIPFDAVERCGLIKYKYFVVPTMSMLVDLKKINPHAYYEIIPYGCSKKLFTFKSREKKYVLFVGRIDLYNKGIDLLLSAWATIIKKGLRYKLVIIGNGKTEDENRMNEMIKSLKIGSYVQWKGRLFGSERNKIMAESMFIVCPSRFETFCIAALEAMAVGKALICSDIKGFSWIPDGVAEKFQNTNTASLTKAMIRLLTDNSRRATLSKKSRPFAMNFEWDTITSEYERLFKKIVGPRT